jgi:hypothetical protein
MKTASITAIVFLCVMGMYATAGELPKTTNKGKGAPVQVRPRINMTELPQIIDGYPISYSTSENRLVVDCSDSNEFVCFAINYETGEFCIDPNNSNPNIGATHFPGIQQNGEWYEIISDDGAVKKVLLYTPLGYEKRRK